MNTSSRPSRGVMLIGLMVLLALSALALLQFGESAATTRQRERETQLLWVGQQYRAALESYWRATPGHVKQMPLALEDLVHDPRFPNPVRHLRKLYADPLQPEVPWGLVRRGNQILGVHSQSGAAPLRRTGFATDLESFEGAAQYTDWRFLFVPRIVQGTAPAQTVKP